MDAVDLRMRIDGLTQDIDFEYKGKLGAICPFSRESISLCYDGSETTVNSVDAAMSTPFIDGLSLSDVCADLNI